MRRLALLVLSVLMLVRAVPVGAAAAEAPVIPAKAYLLMDATTGQVLISYEGDTPLPVASTTKIMTAILAIERGDLADLVTVGEKPYETGGSTIWLAIGEQQTLENLLYALMLESANDAAVAIAEHLAGTEEQFAGWMNETARALGATRTQFVNSHGLHDPDHWSTAHDLALIARYALKNETFRRIITVEEVEIPGAPGNAPRRLVSHNRLLGYYEGANGVKNGFTEEAGLTNVASARRGESEYIAVVLGAESRLWTSSMALLDVGFERYETRWLARAGEKFSLGDLEARVDEDLAVTLERGVGSAVAVNEELPGLAPPVAVGQQVGWRVWRVGGREVGRLPLLAAVALSAPSPVAEAAGPVQAAPRAVGGGEAAVWLLLWIGGALLATFQLNGLRNKGGIARGAS